MNAIVAADANWAIGKDNHLLLYNACDMDFFKRMTMSRTLLVGRKTLESFPEGKPLYGRKHIVLTRDMSYLAHGCTIVHSFNDALAALRHIPPDDVFVAGGGSIYRLALPYCKTIYVTKTHGTFDADTFFPNLDSMSDWQLTYQGTCHFCEFKGVQYPFQFLVYQRKLFFNHYATEVR